MKILIRNKHHIDIVRNLFSSIEGLAFREDEMGLTLISERVKRELLLDRLAEDLCEKGLDFNDEVNEYGSSVEGLIDLINGD